MFKLFSKLVCKPHRGQIKRVAEKGGNSPEKGIVSVPFWSSTHTLSQVAPCFPPLFTMIALGPRALQQRAVSMEKPRKVRHHEEGTLVWIITIIALTAKANSHE